VKFKVGDKVKILWGKTPYYSYYYADKGEIVGIFERRFYDEYLVRGFNEESPLHTLAFREDELILLEVEKQTMKKSDLKQGAIVKLRNNQMYILIGKKFVNLTDGEYMSLERYDDDLYFKTDYLYFKTDAYDVMKVFNSSLEHEGYFYYIRNKLIIKPWTWERKEEEPSKELTVGEIEKLLGYKVKIIKEETNE